MGRDGRFHAVVALFFILALPVTGAQATDYPGCSQSPETCDPLTVNGGVKTGTEPVTTLLYAHMLDVLGRQPLNAQAPDPINETDLDRGFVMPTLVVDEPLAPCCRFENNEFVLFQSPGLVEHRPGGNWRTVQEPGVDAPVELVDEMVAYVYLSPDSVPDAVPDDAAPIGVMPAVGVFVRAESGWHPWAGDLIAQGDTGMGYPSSDPTGLPGSTTMLSRPGQEVVYEFVVPMPVRQAVIEAGIEAGGFIVTVRPYQVSVMDEVEFASADWRVRTGAEYPWRIHMTTPPLLNDEGAAVYVQDGGVRFRWSVLASLGYYDVDVASAALRFEGPVGSGGLPGDVATELIRVRWPYNAHGHVEPLNLTWEAAIPASDLPDGDYRVHASVKNLQGTYLLERTATIRVEQGVPRFADGESLSSEKAPGPGIAAALVVGALAAAFVVARRPETGKP